MRILLLTLIAASVAAAQDDKAAVEAAERKFNECVVKKDKACITAMTTPEFAMHVATEGRPLAPATRDLYLRMVENQALTFQSVDEVKVSVAGGVALASLRMRLISEGGGGGRGLTGSFLMSDVWVKSGGDWKLAARNAGRAEKAPGN